MGTSPPLFLVVKVGLPSSAMVLLFAVIPKERVLKVLYGRDIYIVIT